MEHSEILSYANENLWYLREGDYLPAPLKDFNGGRGIWSMRCLDEMRQLGTVYPTRETASIVSEKVRALLGQASLECLVSMSKCEDND